MIQKDVDNIHMFKKLAEISVFYPSMYKLIVDISGKIYNTNLELMFCFVYYLLDVCSFLYFN